jgi:hypothetical protein
MVCSRGGVDQARGRRLGGQTNGALATGLAGGFPYKQNRLAEGPDLFEPTIAGLRHEARQMLKHFTPPSPGQALRISGVTPADMTVLAIHLEPSAGGADEEKLAALVSDPHRQN